MMDDISPETAWALIAVSSVVAWIAYLVIKHITCENRQNSNDADDA